MISYPKEENRADRVGEFFSLNGALAKSYEAYEFRDQQVRMASAVEKAFEKCRHLVVEAGTGVGKSFAYLIPAIYAAASQKCKVLISTYTITLQEQLINKDIPFLAEVLEIPFEACLAKGRNNFVCLRRLEYAMRKQQGLFDRSMTELLEISGWAKQTNEGSLSELDFMPSASVWNAVRSEHGNCRSRKCPHFNKCFYWRSRRRLESADIIVSNHAMMFSDLVLRRQGVSILPDYKYVVIDEAHNIEHVAEDHFGLQISNSRVSFLLNSLYNSKTKKGFLAKVKAPDALELVKVCARNCKLFFEQVERWYENDRGNGTTRPNFVADTLSESIKKLRFSLSDMAKNTLEEDEKFEICRYTDLLRGVETDLVDFLGQKAEGHVYWVETEKTSRKKISMISAPVNPAGDIKNCLFDEFESVILTSATLCCDGGLARGGFGFFAERVGLDEFEALKLGSPFDYENQVTIYIEPDMPEPNSEGFVEAAAEKIKKYVSMTSGKAFVLFTSYRMLNEAGAILSDWFEEKGIELLMQGSGLDRARLLARFKADTDSVLFGTDSFWQGVDVPGESLSNVIIIRLPFAVPSHPLVAGRIEQIRSSGQSPFFKYQLPSAIIKFKQGFGRLIRSKSDRGIVAVLDSRIVKKSYGREFLSAIDKCRIEIVHD